MAIIYTTGPAHVFIAVPPYSSVTYLGTCEEKPRIKVSRVGRPVRNDIAGDVPMDLSYMGQQAHIGLDLTRFNEIVVAAIDAYPHTGNPATRATRGTDFVGDIGSLAITQGTALGVIIQFPYNLLAPFAANTMPAGYFFPYCAPIPEEQLDTGTQARITHLQFHAIRGYIPATGAQILYTTTLPALPPIN